MMPVKIVHPKTSTKGFVPRTMRSKRHPTIPTRQETPSKRNFSRFRGTSRQYERVLVPVTNERSDWTEVRRSKIGDRKHNTLSPAQTNRRKLCEDAACPSRG